ncbi:hypothetical protein [Kovacikia minuta]|nr:hypothetical protein [Kovacikia minuta]
MGAFFMQKPVSSPTTEEASAYVTRRFDKLTSRLSGAIGYKSP